MFLPFLYTLRAFGLKVSPTEWMAFVRALHAGLVRPRLDDLYAVGRAMLVKSETDYDAWDQAFAAFFAGVEAHPEELDALLRWLSDPVPPPGLSPEQWAALRALDLDALRKAFLERLQEQKERHDGGNRWIGTGGTSPFGHSGRNPAGIRIGGASGGHSAVQIAMLRRFAAYRADLTLDVRQIQVALKRLRRLKRTGAALELDLRETVEQTGRNAGELSIVMRPPRENETRLLLLMDVGGSMTPFSRLVSGLFSAANSLHHFKDFKHYYFHNCIYERLYRDAGFEDGDETARVLARMGHYDLVVVGDAHMAPSELFDRFGAIDYWHANEKPGVHWLARFQKTFARRVWLNPLHPRVWRAATVAHVASMFPMFPLTLAGLEAAVSHLRAPR